MMIEHGNTTVDREWQVNELSPIAFSRVYYVYSGDVIYSDKYVETNLQPDFLYIFPSTTPYSMIQNTEKPLVCTFLHLDLFPSYVSRMISIDLSQNKLLKSILDATAQAIDDGNIKIIMSLAQAFEKYCFEKNIISPPSHVLAKAFDYIAQNAAGNISIDNLSCHCGYNKQYFIKLFKKNVGITPYQYIINYRLKESLRLLAGDNSIAQIACTVGFLDSKAYCRAFKDKFGISPNRYRNNVDMKCFN